MHDYDNHEGDVDDDHDIEYIQCFLYLKHLTVGDFVQIYNFTQLYQL